MPQYIPPPTPDAVTGADTETERFAPGYMAPRITCLGLDGPATGRILLPTPEARDVFVHVALRTPTVWHNGPYDLCCALAWWGCTREIIDALDANLIGDTWVIQRLAIIGGLAKWTDLSLDVLHAAMGLGELPKDPAIRTSYGPLLNRPLSEYTQAQIDYAIDDPSATKRVYARQYRWLDPTKNPQIFWADVCELTRKRVWLEACRDWGLRTNGKKLDDLRLAVERHIGTMRAQAQVPAYLEDEDPTKVPPSEASLVRKDETGCKIRQQALVAAAYLAPKPLPLPGRPLKERVAAAIPLVPQSILTTEPRQAKDAAPRKKKWKPSISVKRNVLEESGDERLAAFAEYGSWVSLESALEHYVAGAYQPIHTKWGVADSTRTTSSKPQVQNLGKKKGIRECFVPRPGFCYVSVDHGGLENATLAQFGIWYLRDRSFADFVNANKDLHTLVASQIYGCSYDEGIRLKKAMDPHFDDCRQAAKKIDFGAPGGAGWKRLRLSAAQEHLIWTEEQAKKYRQAWVDAVPVGAKMHDWVAEHEQPDGRFSVPIPGTTITRRNVTFCSACNNSFQALGAVVESRVGWVMFKERLLDPSSPLAQCAMVNYEHDAFMWEAPLDLSHETAERLEVLMHEAPRAVMPDVTLKSDAVAMAYWSKNARRIVIDGRLRVWPLKCLCGEIHDNKGIPCKCGRTGEYLSDVKAWGAAQ